MARAGLRRLGERTRTVLLFEPGERQGVDERAGAIELGRGAGELKGGMAKVAQLMAYFEGPGAAADEGARAALGELWDRAPAVSGEAIATVVREDLGAEPEAIFASFAAEPLAAASLGQVHAAVGRDGREYAVKVQYPGIAAALRDDVSSPSLVRRLAGGELGRALGKDALEALGAAVLAELDYAAEGQALRGFASAFAGDEQIVVPGWNQELSSARVLTMERMHGRPLLSCVDDPQAGRDAIGEVLFRFGWAAPLVHGLVHADPNPGNYVVMSTAPARVAFLDFGCTAVLDDDTRGRDLALWRALVHHDPFVAAERFRTTLHEQGMVRRAQVFFHDSYREWERLVLAPFGAADGFVWTSGYARELSTAMSELLATGDLGLPGAVVLLWRQRLGMAAVLGRLSPRIATRRALQAML